MANLNLSSLQSTGLTVNNGVIAVNKGISSVDITKSMIWSTNQSISVSPESYLLATHLLNSTNIRYERIGSTSSLDATSFVAEFSSGMLAQHYTHLMTSETFNFNLNTSVILGKSWVQISYNSSKTALGREAMVRAELINGGADVFLSRISASFDPLVTISVYQVDNASVIAKSKLQSSVGVDTDLGATIDLDTSLLFCSWKTSTNILPNQLPAVFFKNSSTIGTSYYATVDSPSPEMHYFAVTCPEFDVFARPIPVFSNGETTQTITAASLGLPSFDLATMAAKLNNPMGFGASNNTSSSGLNCTFDVYFIDDQNLIIQRSGTLNQATIPLELVQFVAGDPITVAGRKAVMEGVMRGVFTGVM